MKKKTTVLISPLNWGLGHAARVVPIIKQLIQYDINIIIGAEGKNAAFLKQEFPNLLCIQISEFSITYHSRGKFVLKMLANLPNIILSIQREHNIIKNLIKQHQIDIVISDNRYGLWNKHIKTIIITHQLNIQVPKSLIFLKPIINYLLNNQLRRFNEVWIPDNGLKPAMAGKLSNPTSRQLNYRHIGLLSRFGNDKQVAGKIIYDVLIILSGPEPQRGILEKELFDLILNSGIKAAMVVGKPELKEESTHHNIDMYSHLSTEELHQMITTSELVITRSGYTSIMDLLLLQKNAILIPTPGQTEQEYLALYYKKLKIFACIAQKKISINKLFEENHFCHINNSKIVHNQQLLHSAIESLFE